MRGPLFGKATVKGAFAFAWVVAWAWAWGGGGIAAWGVEREAADGESGERDRPHVVLLMADDQGWGQVGLAGHPVLDTPHLDAMAANALRFHRFYAGAPVCSPTRASVLTGRSNMRTGVKEHGYALRREERTLASVMKEAGYATGHFGKWHLNGLRGPGVPMFLEDEYHPGRFGFETWLSVSNYFDRDPLMSRNGVVEALEGDSSEIIVREALSFIEARVGEGRPTFSVIWYGSPHAPFRAAAADTEGLSELDARSREHHGELVALDRSVGMLRGGLRALGIAEDTVVWYCSDNGGLPGISPSTVGNLRGFKGSLYEGGLRVPAFLEWPRRVKGGEETWFPAVTMDIFPTLAEAAGLPAGAPLAPQDGMSLMFLLEEPEGRKRPRAADERREKPIPFHCFNTSVWLDYPYKLMCFSPGEEGGAERFELYHLEVDPGEARDLYAARPEVGRRLRGALAIWLRSMEASVAGRDYPEGRVLPGYPEPRPWMGEPAYAPYYEAWVKRPEYGESWRRFRGKR